MPLLSDPEEVICLDAEFVEGDELIELSVYSIDRTPIYYSRFRPERYTRWDSSIHHITPEMVADAPTFASERPAIQKIIDSARHLVGFAISNDISHLARQSIQRLDKCHIIELREWYWINHGLGAGLDLFQNVSLASVIETLGIEFSADGMHSASGDTLATLDAFLLMYERFRTARGFAPEQFEAAVKEFDEVYAREKLEYDRTHAEGYALLLRAGNGYTLRIKREEPRPSERLVASIRVADRQRASVELRNLMARRPLIGREVYKLTPRDIEEFKNYTNGFDTDDHAYFKKLQGLSSRFNVSGLKKR